MREASAPIASWVVIQPAVMVAAVAVVFTAIATAEAAPPPPPPPPPPVHHDPGAPPIADTSSEELLDHRQGREIRVVEPAGPKVPWLTASGDCGELLRVGELRKARICADSATPQVGARAAELLADFDGAGLLWRDLQRKSVGAMSMEVMRRSNAMAEVEDAVAATVSGVARAAITRLMSARQTAKRQEATPSLNMTYPAAISLQLGLSWRLRKKYRKAETFFAEAAKGRQAWVTVRANVYKRRVASRKGRGGPWPLIERAYGSRGDDVVRAAARSNNDDILLTGSVTENGADGVQLAVWRVDPTGRPRWQQTFGGPGVDEGHALVGLRDGGVLVVGETADTAGGTEILALRVAPNRKVVWHHSYGGPGHDRAVGVIERPGGTFWVATTTQAGTPEADVRLLTLSENGADSRLLRLGGGGEDRAATIIGRGKGALIAGSGRPNKDGPWEGRLIAIDERAQVMWRAPVRHGDGCGIDAAVAARKGGTLVVGHTREAGSVSRVFVGLVAQGGRVAWTRTDRRLADASIGGVVRTGRNHVAILARGKSADSTAGVWLLGYRGKRPRWQAEIAGDGVSAIHGLVGVGRYGLVAVGSVADRGAGRRDGWLLRTGR